MSKNGYRKVGNVAGTLPCLKTLKSVAKTSHWYSITRDFLRWPHYGSIFLAGITKWYLKKTCDTYFELLINVWNDFPLGLQKARRQSTNLSISVNAIASIKKSTYSEITGESAAYMDEAKTLLDEDFLILCLRPLD